MQRCPERDERVNAFLSRPQEGAWPNVLLDETYGKTRDGVRIGGRAVMIAVAVNEDGRREVLGVATGSLDTETSWAVFCAALPIAASAA